MVRLKDIAEKTGYSINTVSLALNRKGCVSETARKAIEACAEEMGYVANFTAQKLRSGKSMVLALIVDDLVGMGISIVVNDVVRYASEKGYVVDTFVTGGEPETEKNAIATAISREVDGVIITPVKGTKENAARLEKHEIPYVLLGRAFDEFGAELSVTYDETRSGYIAAEHLLIRGHENIAVLSYRDLPYINECRINGMTMAFMVYGRFFEESEICYLSERADERCGIIADFAENIGEVSAVICHDDMVALELYMELKKIGKAIPGDVSIIGLGNITKSYAVSPFVTNIDTSDEPLAHVAVDLLIEKINGNNPEKRVLPVRLSEGGSVRDLHQR